METDKVLSNPPPFHILVLVKVMIGVLYIRGIHMACNSKLCITLTVAWPTLAILKCAGLVSVDHTGPFYFNSVLL